MLLGIRPGHDTRLETAASIADVQAALKARAKTVPAGEFITAMGGWNPAQFVEKRLPTLAELDAAAPDHPVLVFQAFTGPAATNTRGKAFLSGKGVAVSDAGLIGANAPSLAALNALRAVQTLDDRKRGTLDAMAYSASVGVTTNVDMGAFIPPGLADTQESFAADTLATADPFRMYDAITALHREHKVSTRVRLFFLSMDTKPDVPMLKQRLLNTFNGFGDDMLRVSGIGEFATSWPLFGQPAPTNYVAALQLIAKQGWAFQQHSLSPAEDQLTIGAFETVNQTTPIAGLRWSIAHAPRIDVPTINRFKALGAGIAVHPFGYLAGAAGAGPAAPHDRGQRDSRRRRVGFGADLDARSVADHLLHGDRQELLGRADQRRASSSRAWRRCGCIRPRTAGSSARKTSSARSSRASSATSSCSATITSIRPRSPTKRSSVCDPSSPSSTAGLCTIISARPH